MNKSVTTSLSTAADSGADTATSRGGVHIRTTVSAGGRTILISEPSVPVRALNDQETGRNRNAFADFRSANEHHGGSFGDRAATRAGSYSGAGADVSAGGTGGGTREYRSVAEGIPDEAVARFEEQRSLGLFAHNMPNFVSSGTGIVNGLDSTQDIAVSSTNSNLYTSTRSANASVINSANYTQNWNIPGFSDAGSTASDDIASISEAALEAYAYQEDFDLDSQDYARLLRVRQLIESPSMHNRDRVRREISALDQGRGYSAAATMATEISSGAVVRDSAPRNAVYRGGQVMPLRQYRQNPVSGCSSRELSPAMTSGIVGSTAAACSNRETAPDSNYTPYVSINSNAVSGATRITVSSRRVSAVLSQQARQAQFQAQGLEQPGLPYVRSGTGGLDSRALAAQAAQAAKIAQDDTNDGVSALMNIAAAETAAAQAEAQAAAEAAAKARNEEAAARIAAAAAAAAEAEARAAADAAKGIETVVPEYIGHRGFMADGVIMPDENMPSSSSVTITAGSGLSGLSPQAGSACPVRNDPRAQALVRDITAQGHTAISGRIKFVPEEQVDELDYIRIVRSRRNEFIPSQEGSGNFLSLHNVTWGDHGIKGIDSTAQIRAAAAQGQEESVSGLLGRFNGSAERAARVTAAAAAVAAANALDDMERSLAPAGATGAARIVTAGAVAIPDDSCGRDFYTAKVSNLTAQEEAERQARLAAEADVIDNALLVRNSTTRIVTNSRKAKLEYEKGAAIVEAELAARRAAEAESRLQDTGPATIITRHAVIMRHALGRPHTSLVEEALTPDEDLLEDFNELDELNNINEPADQSQEAAAVASGELVAEELTAVDLDARESPEVEVEAEDAETAPVETDTAPIEAESVAIEGVEAEAKPVASESVETEPAAAEAKAAESESNADKTGDAEVSASASADAAGQEAEAAARPTRGRTSARKAKAAAKSTKEAAAATVVAEATEEAVLEAEAPVAVKATPAKRKRSARSRRHH